ncbi:MAG: DUF5817 domain-containing protein [Candidatus Methanogasteraceae archaeon]
MQYSVIVCPKCKEHAQIIESGIKSTVCQRCGSRLDVRKLKIWHTTPDLSNAVSVRTAILMELDQGPIISDQ